MGFDLAHIMAVDHLAGVATGLLKADARKSHKRIKVLPKDYKYMTGNINGRRYANTCCTYGFPRNMCCGCQGLRL